MGWIRLDRLDKLDELDKLDAGYWMLDKSALFKKFNEFKMFKLVYSLQPFESIKPFKLFEHNTKHQTPNNKQKIKRLKLPPWGIEGATKHN